MEIKTKFDIGQKVSVIINKKDGWHHSYLGKQEGFVREIEIDKYGLTYVVQIDGEGQNGIVVVGEKRIKAVGKNG